MENRLVNWSMLGIKLKEIYKINTFDFHSKKILHTIESIKIISNKHETNNLLDRKLLENYNREDYRYIPIQD